MKNNIKKTIAILGAGYVGLSNAIILSQKNHVIIVDVKKAIIDKINKRISPLNDKEIIDYLKNKRLDLIAITDSDYAIKNANYIFISVPTNYNEKTKKFDTSIIESLIKKIDIINRDAIVVIKSTIPIGYTDYISNLYPNLRIVFSPEFLREGKALYDNLFPSRIIVGTDINNIYKYEAAVNVSKLLMGGAIKKGIDTLIIGTKEAESVKLFANTYLAMRVSFFNELDTYAIYNSLNSAQIIEGISLDPRIGKYYNNPSFGYGGYCLPKDTKQLASNFKNIPAFLPNAIVDSNTLRKKIIAGDIYKNYKVINKKNKCIGIYRLIMKTGSDNFRESSIIDVIKILQKKKAKIVLYEPSFANFNLIKGLKIVKNLNNFKKISDIIIANRYSSDLDSVKYKVYTRDVYHEC